MTRLPNRRLTLARLAVWGSCAALFVGVVAFSRAPEPAAPARRATPRTVAIPFPVTLEIAEGTNAAYRVREQFVGIKFPSDAVGRSTAVTGQITFNKDGSIDSASSKFQFDLRTLQSDQSMRDGYIQRNTLETDKYPMAVFVPRTIVDMPNPLTGQFGFELSGDMTVHGVTAPLTWQGIATVDRSSGAVAGRAETHFKFGTFGLTPPKIMRLLSVADSINLEVEFRTRVK